MLASSEPAVVAAVVTASVAAAVAVLSAIINLAGNGLNNARSAHRALLGASLEDLGRHVGGIVATSTTYLRRAESAEGLANWRQRAEAHARGLMEIRSTLRYPLYGLDEGLRVLSRVGSWIQHYSERPEEGRRFLDAADVLRRELDDAIAKSYRRGDPPTRRDRRKVDQAAERVRALWDRRMSSSVGEAASEAPAR
jgi:hypothetical protein